MHVESGERNEEEEIGNAVINLEVSYAARPQFSQGLLVGRLRRGYVPMGCPMGSWHYPW